jgi:hypothetical protein
LQIHERWLPLFAVRAPSPAENSPHQSPESKRLPFQLHFPAQLTRGGLESPVMAGNGRHAERFKSFEGPRRLQENRRLQIQIDRVEELVWRRGQRSPTVTEESGREPERPESNRGLSARSTPSHDGSAAMSPAAMRTAALQAAKLDPALLDRLTDDVIRRVEQRIRIERQRRGL